MTFIKNNSYVLLIFVLCMGFAIIGVNKYDKEANESWKLQLLKGIHFGGSPYHHSENMSTE